MKKLVSGIEIDMSPAEEAEFIASIQRTLPQAKAEAKQRIVARAKEEQDDGNLLEAANPGNRVNAVRQNARQLWLAVKACNTVAEVDAIDLNAGW